MNMLFLNYFTNALYFIMVFVLVLTYYIPNLERYLPFMKNREREYRGFVRKKVFFFTVTLCICHIYFEYYWFCTPAFFSTLFNTIIVTILARSITSYFSTDGIIKCTHKHATEDKVYAQIEVKDIKDVSYFYMRDKRDNINDDNDDDRLKKYKVNYSTEGYIYICEEEKNQNKDAEKEKKRLLSSSTTKFKEKKYFWVITIVD